MFKSDINLNLYKTFYDVARYGSFSKTAELTFSTQPAISKAIKKLESELQTELFYRKASGVELTDKGRELLFYVEKSFGNLLTAERILLETESLDRGKLSIGIPSNLISYVMHNIVDFHTKYPNIEITIMTGSTTYLLEKLELHKIDFIIDMGPVVSVNSNLKIEKLWEAKYCFVSANNDKYNNITNLKSLQKYPLILPIPGTNNREQLNELFIKKNISISNIINVHTSEIIREFVLNDLGIGYMLYDFVKDDIEKGILKLISLRDDLPSAKISLVYNKKFLTKVPKKFIENYITNI